MDDLVKRLTKELGVTKKQAQGIERQMAIAKARAQSKPQLFETAYAAVDIFQMHLTRLRAETAPPDIYLTTDMRDALPNAFDRADEFIE